MAFSMKDSSAELAENHEINVTPFIDVMLVLLIIFMVAAPLATVSVPVDLPASAAQPAVKPEEPVYLTIQADLTLTLGEKQQVTQQSLPLILSESLPDKTKRIFLRADKTVPYGEMMQVMNVLATAGYTKVALVGLEMVGEQPAL